MNSQEIVTIIAGSQFLQLYRPPPGRKRRITQEEESLKMNCILLSPLLCCYVYFLGLTGQACSLSAQPSQYRDSLRKNITRIEETGIKAVDRLFDINLLTPEQMSLRSMYLTRHYLSIFRSYYRNGNHKEGVRYYHKAIKESPRSLLEWSYMRKYLRCIGKKLMSIQLSK